jgi:hypothetical protein
MSIKFCPRCGTQIPPQGWMFCAACGYKLNNQNESSNQIPNSTQNHNNLMTAKGYFVNALTSLQNAYNSLRGAKGFATWDTFFGGGFFADAMKFDKVDQAKQLVNQAFQNLNAGYALVPQAPRIRNVQVHDNNMVWDMLFDNIFSDWSAREKIKESIQSVENAISDTQGLINWIDQQLRI